MLENNLTEAIDYIGGDVDSQLYYINQSRAILADVKERAAVFYEYRSLPGYEDISVTLFEAAAKFEETLDYMIEMQLAFYDGQYSRGENYASMADDSLEEARYYRQLVGDWLTSVGR